MIPAVTRTRSFRMPRGVVALGKTLLDQQLWCWGRDILARRGNLLLEYGADRVAAPRMSEAGSLYYLRPDRRTTIVLRGYGVFCGRRGQGAIFLRRFEFQPRLLLSDVYPPNAFEPEDLPPSREPKSSRRRSLALTLAAVVAKACADYEAFVLTQFGVNYRRAVLRRWSDLGKPTIAADATPSTWLSLASQLKS